jgi:hypothetical protein
MLFYTTAEQEKLLNSTEDRVFYVEGNMTYLMVCNKKMLVDIKDGKVYSTNPSYDYDIKKFIEKKYIYKITFILSTLKDNVYSVILEYEHIKLFID